MYDYDGNNQTTSDFTSGEINTLHNVFKIPAANGNTDGYHMNGGRNKAKKINYLKIDSGNSVGICNLYNVHYYN